MKVQRKIERLFDCGDEGRPALTGELRQMIDKKTILGCAGKSGEDLRSCEAAQTLQDAGGTPLHAGDKVITLSEIPYMMGQISSDKLNLGEILTIEGIDEKKQAIYFTTIPDRYRNWEAEDFIKVSGTAKDPKSKYRVVAQSIMPNKRGVLTYHESFEDANAATDGLQSSDFMDHLPVSTALTIEEKKGNKWVQSFQEYKNND